MILRGGKRINPGNGGGDADRITADPEEPQLQINQDAFPPGTEDLNEPGPSNARSPIATQVRNGDDEITVEDPFRPTRALVNTPPEERRILVSPIAENQNQEKTPVRQPSPEHQRPQQRIPSLHSRQSSRASTSTRSRIDLAQKELEMIEEVATMEEEFERRQLLRRKMIAQKRLELEKVRAEESEGEQNLIESVISKRTMEWVDAMNDVNSDGSEKSDSMYTAQDRGSRQNLNPPPALEHGLEFRRPWQPTLQPNVNKQVEVNKQVGNKQTFFSENDQINRGKPSANVRNDRANENRKVQDGKSEEKSSENVVHEMKTFIARQTIKRDLPQFSGRPEDWPGFIFDFKETTKTCNFSNAENLHRLRKALTGKAKEAVESFLVLPENVPDIIKTLEKRLGRPELIIETHIGKINRMSPPTEDKLESIIDFSDKIRNLVTSMQVLNDERHVYNPHLVNGFVGKLPNNMKLLWAQKLATSGEAPNIKIFSKWLDDLSDTVNVLPAKPARHSEDNRRRENILVTQAGTNNPSTRKCTVCNKENHPPEKCEEFEKLPLDKRWEVAKEKKMCFRCLGKRHFKDLRAKCPEKEPCGTNGCKGRHHPLLHYVMRNDQAPAPAPAFNGFTRKVTTETLLRVCPVKLKNTRNGKQIDVYALFDEGSSSTLLDEEVADTLGLEGVVVPLNMNWLNGQTHKELSKIVSLTIEGEDGNEYVLKGVRTVKNLDIRVKTVDSRKIIERWKNISTFELSELINVKPVILLGEDHVDLTIPREVVEFGQNLPMASKSKLGWTLHGRFNMKERVDEGCYFHTYVDEDVSHLEQLVKESFALDALPYKIPTQKKHSEEEKRALEIIETTRKKVDGHWQIGHLWKDDKPNLPNNHDHSFNRLKSMERKMDKDPEFKKAYERKINEYVEKGYARKVDNPEDVPGKTWYLPHFGVWNPNKPGKMRFVFDAAAKFRGVSLNDALLKGLVLLLLLFDVLLRFREKPIAFVADIKEMFHQVKIQPEDRYAQRFLWRGEDRHGPPHVYEMSAMTFGAVSSPFCAQYVLTKNAEMYAEEFPEVLAAVKRNHYVDDYLGGADDVKEGKRIVKNVIDVHEKGGFVIRGWLSNSKELLSDLPESLLSDKIKEIDPSKELPMEKVLGLNWNPNEDVLQLSYTAKLKEELETESLITKRKILRTVMSISDPLGIALPVTTEGKIIMQEAWTLGVGWDEPLPEGIISRWNKWIDRLKMEKFAIPRCLFPRRGTPISIQIHSFCDASSKAYGAVSYLRAEYVDQVTLTFLAAKSRVAPMKQKSIPRLELQAAVLALRLSNAFREATELKPTKFKFWTDSSTVVKWIRKGSYNFKTFVANRIGEIEESSSIEDWNWVPTAENPADELTRPEKIIENSKWLNGPDFLLLKEESWPKLVDLETTEASLDEEAKVLTTIIDESINLKESLPDPKRFSKYTRLVRATAFVQKFIDLRIRKTVSPLLTVEDIEIAEERWWKFVQLQSFFEEISNLKDGKPIQKSSRLYQTEAYLDNRGILRSRNRINTDPVILDPKHRYVKLLIQLYHERAYHQGVNTVIGNLREKYHILGIRVAVKRTFAQCQTCIVRKSKPNQPRMALLPLCRRDAWTNPFHHTGIDYFGPIEVTIGRRHEKRYGVILTCLTTRAIHLEIASQLDLDSCLMALRRFMARRGIARFLYSDNGGNFEGANNEVKRMAEIYNSDEAKNFYSTHGMEWKFNPPYAPNMGGAWERLIRSVKTALNAVLFHRHPKEEVLTTVLTEIENVVNSRPLTHVMLDSAEEEPLTPNDLIRPGIKPITPMFTSTERDLINPRKRYKIAEALSDMFWTRWIREYLPIISMRSKWKNGKGQEVKVGDVVLMVDGDSPRNTWIKGVVEKTFPGKDGVNRVVEVRTVSGKFRRPVSKLCVIYSPTSCSPPEDVKNRNSKI